MKILYGIQGTGNGHLTRSRILIESLRAKNISVDTLISARKYENIWDMASFSPCQVREGISFIYSRGKVDSWRTLTHCNIAQFWRDINNLDLSSYDLVISDYEPISAWAAKRQGLRSIGISHQCAFLYNIPKVKGMWLQKIIMNRIVPVDIAIGLHWHHFGQPILPPITAKLCQQEIDEKTVLVYLPFEYEADIKKNLEPFSDYSFIIYGSHGQAKVDGHLTWKTFSRLGFLRDIEKSSAVISNSGFEFVSESLTLGKKILVKPMHGQPEQVSNAKALEQLNLGSSTMVLGSEVIDAWLKKDNAKWLPYINVADPLAEWVASGNYDNLSGLVHKIWNI